ncbi:MAG: redoxin domain-containing protein [Planctomycetes bacterium]|nr:redoxin domain-containing protein [Planctomycetota bacterium]
MSRPTLAALFLLSCPAVAFAQVGDATAPAEQQDPQTVYNNLVKAFQQAITEWRTEAIAAVNAARKEGKPMPAIAQNPPTKKYIEQAQARALDYAGEDDAIRFHGFVLKSANNEHDAVKKSLLTLTMDHAESEAIGEVMPFVMAGLHHGAKSEVMDLFAEVIESNPSKDCKAKALIARGSMLLQAAENAEERAAAQKDLESVAGVTEDADLRAEAEDALFEVRHLQVGCEAPDIAGKDVDGVEFKLSDYRGKAVLLDFWGFW